MCQIVLLFKVLCPLPNYPRGRLCHFMSGRSLSTSFQVPMTTLPTWTQSATDHTNLVSFPIDLLLPCGFTSYYPGCIKNFQKMEITHPPKHLTNICSVPTMCSGLGLSTAVNRTQPQPSRSLLPNGIN